MQLAGAHPGWVCLAATAGPKSIRSGNRQLAANCAAWPTARAG